MREWSLDLHLHSILSPCGGDEMLPIPVMERLKELGTEIIALTDHNTGENAASFIEKGREYGITVLPGMELQTVEDIHLVCLFDNLPELESWQEMVYDRLPPARNREKSLGEQWVVDPEGRKIRQVERLLLVGSSFSVEKAVAAVHDLGGLCLAAHIDRQAFSLRGYLGYIPEDIPFDGMELTPHLPRVAATMEELQKKGFSYVVSSDAHYLGDIRPPHTFAGLEAGNLSELKMALRGERGRYIRNIR